MTTQNLHSSSLSLHHFLNFSVIFQEFRKLIKLEGLSAETNLRILIEEILDQCPFITEDSLPTLTSVLEVLKNRKYDRNGVADLSVDGETPGGPGSGKLNFLEYFQDEDGLGAETEGDMKEVKMDSLDLYVELLYEELQDKIKGARSLWRLTNSSENLVTIFNHGEVQLVQPHSIHPSEPME